MAGAWVQLLLLFLELSQQTAVVRGLDICTETLACDSGFYCCSSSPSGCCLQADRNAEIGYIVGGVMAMLAAGGYGYWRYKVARRSLRWRRDAERPPLPAASGGRVMPPLPPATVMALPAPPGWTPDVPDSAAETPPWAADAVSYSETSPLLSSRENH